MRAFGVNDSGVVAGESVLSPTRREATLWSPTGVRNGLGTLPNPGNANFSSVAFGVNNAGVAAGWSDSADSTRAFRWTLVGDAVGADGQVHAVLLTPVPEPTTWALMRAGLLTTCMARKRRSGS